MDFRFRVSQGSSKLLAASLLSLSGSGTASQNKGVGRASGTVTQARKTKPL